MQLIYDFSQSGYPNWSQLGLASFLVFLAVVLFWHSRRKIRQSSIRLTILSLLLCGFGLAVGAIFGFNYWFYLEIKSANKESKHETTEGLVTEFQPPRRYSSTINGSRLSPATFNVSGVQFRCWDKNTENGQIGFQRSDLIHNGMLVRVCYVHLRNENIITRLEIAQ